MREVEFLKDTLRMNLKSLIESKVNEEIETEVDKFRERLVNRKDQYIAEIMKGIRLEHETNPATSCVNYRITFENIVKVERNDNHYPLID